MQITKNPSYYTWLPNLARWLITPPQVYAILAAFLLLIGGYWASQNLMFVPKQQAQIPIVPIQRSVPQQPSQQPTYQPQPVQQPATNLPRAYFVCDGGRGYMDGNTCKPCDQVNPHAIYSTQLGRCVPRRSIP